MDETGFAGKLAAADLVITGEGRIDAQTAFGKTALGVAQRAHAAGVACIAVGGGVDPEGEAVLAGLGAITFGVGESPTSLEAAMAAGTAPVRRCGRRIARLVEPGRGPCPRPSRRVVTAQAMDLVEWRGKTWSLVGIDGVGLFDPTALGIQPRMLHTAAWRGYICTYMVEDDELRLERLEVGFDPETHERSVAGDPPVIGDAQADPAGKRLTSGSTMAQTSRCRFPAAFASAMGSSGSCTSTWASRRPGSSRRSTSSGSTTAGLPPRRTGPRRCKRSGNASRPARAIWAPPRSSGVERIAEWIRRTFDRSYRK